MGEKKPNPQSNRGRRSKYKKKYAREIVRFFSKEPYEMKAVKTSVEYFANGKVKKKSEEKKPVPEKLPTFFGFCRYLHETYPDDFKVIPDPDMLHRWAHSRVGKKDEASDVDKRPFKNPEFYGAYNACKNLQKDFLIQNGLAGCYPPASYIFTAKNITDMRDRIEVPVDDTGNPVSGFIVLPTRMTRDEAEKEYNTDNDKANKKAKIETA